LASFGKSVVDRRHGLGHQDGGGYKSGPSSPKLAKNLILHQRHAKLLDTLFLESL
jgi:hypothetical protein